MQLSPAAALLMEAVTGGHGLDLQNADCSICANQTLEAGASEGKGSTYPFSSHLSSCLVGATPPPPRGLGVLMPEVADGAFLNASGELSSLSSGFLSMATCLHERVRLSGSEAVQYAVLPSWFCFCS